jgi:hypothetical protein
LWCFLHFKKYIAKDEAITVDDFSGADGNGGLENGTVKDESVELTVFATGIGVRGKVEDEGLVELATGEAGGEDFAVDANGDRAEFVGVKGANEFARVVFPDGKESGHADAGKILFAVGAEIFEEDVAESDFADALIEVDTQGFFHAGFVDGIDTLGRDADFVKGQINGLGLAVEKFAADTVHGNAVVAFGDGSEEGDDLNVGSLEKGVEGHGGVFAAGPAEEDGFGHF